MTQNMELLPQEKVEKVDTYMEKTKSKGRIYFPADVLW